jgi:cysteine-rich repeat protein
MVGSPISMNRARDTVAAIGWLFLIMIASAAGAQYATSPTAISALGISGAGSEGSSSDPRAQLGQSLGERLLGAGGKELIPIRVTLRHQDLPARGRGRREAIAYRQDRVLASPALSGRALRRRYKEVAGFAMTVPASAIDGLLRNPEVLAVHLDGEIHMALAEGRALMGSDAFTNLCVRGAGINVAVIDTGIDTKHLDLMSSLVAEQCFCDTHPSPNLGGCCPGSLGTASGSGAAEDDEGHGTSVSGIITSDGIVAPLGVAPDAGIVAVKVLSSTGSGTASDLDAALDWVLQNFDDEAAPIHIVNMSLSDGGEFDSTGISACSTTPTAVAISGLAAVGVAVFAASGNDGHDLGISAPACVAEAISVGGVYDAAVGSVGWCGNASCTTILCSDASGPDVFVCHSNSGSLLDVLAPDWGTLTSKMGGGTRGFGGTSAASPYASGVAALLLELAPGTTPANLRTHLVSAGVSVTNSDNALSFPRIDVAGSVAAALPDCGDGVLDAGESCDDGNNVGADCCTAICTFEAAGTTCNDATVCTTSDQCDGAGGCGGTSIVCDDANGCTDDSCDPVGGCGNVSNTAACDDGDACTEGDVCSAGSCSPGGPIDCDDVNPCTDDSCDPIGGCGFGPNTAVCDDGDACTNGDICSAGSCVPGPPLVCDDVNPCTDDACNSASGCGFVANSVACDDGSSCTSDDVCSASACMPGPILDCDDLDACTADACDEIDGCTHAAIEGCGVPSVPLLGLRGQMGLLMLLAGVGGSMALLLGRRFTP